MKNFSFFLLLLGILFVGGCSKNSFDKANNQLLFEYKQGENPENLDIGIYKNWFMLHDGYHELTYYAFGPFFRDDSEMVRLGGYTHELWDAPEDTSRLTKFFVNQHSFSTFRELLPLEQAQFAKNNMGKEINLRYIEEEGKEIYNVPMYFPQGIYVDTIRSEISRLPNRGDIGNFKIENKLYYTYDEKNDNGLLISISYSGHNIGATLNDIQNNTQGTPQVKRYLFVPEDDGVIEFPGGFFDGIPDGGLIYIQINRSNLQVFDLNGTSQKLNAMSTFGLDLALDR